MNRIDALAQQVSLPFLRIAMGIVLLWIGALKFVDPAPVVGLLKASFPFLAFDGVVYLLGTVEVILALFLFAGLQTRYVGIVLMGLFAGTLAIFLIAPAVTYGDGGFPRLSLAGEFLLKDLVLFGASLSLVALSAGRQMARAPHGLMRAGQASPAK